MLIIFLSLLFSKYNYSYYENKNVLTEEAINKFERDLKLGKKINPKDYLPKEKNYNNKASEYARKTSKYIEIGFNRGLKYIMQYIESLQN